MIINQSHKFSLICKIAIIISIASGQLAKATEELPSRNYAYQLMEKKEFADAVNAFSDMIRDAPSRKAFVARGIAFMQIDKNKKALADFNAAIALDGSSSIAFTNRGALYLKMDDSDSAVADFTTALGLSNSKDNASVYALRAGAYSNMGCYAKAAQDYTKSLRTRPKDSTTLVSRAYCYLRMNKWQAAIEDTGRVIDSEDVIASAYIIRSRSHSLAGDHKASHEDLLTASKLFPGDVYIVAFLADSFLYCDDVCFRDYDKAIGAAMKFCQLTEWTSNRALEILVDSYSLSGRHEEGVEALKNKLGDATDKQNKAIRVALRNLKNKQLR